MVSGGGRYALMRDQNNTEDQLRLTGSKLDTPITAPMMAVTTTPPAAILSRKFFSDGETPLAASATSGTTIDAVNAAAVNPVTAFSFSEALTLNLPAAGVALDDRRGSGFKKAPAIGCVFWLARTSGTAMDNAEVVAAIVNLLVLFFFCVSVALDVK
ncbi:Unknown protein [Striga hermonthica]|uniref:Uncharacterized protein n=1 Tax=Striga hermonthica TaxID=68872 RepID=A0A9N7MT02_STRHE|nr:Unknown protein [Striga hermonthica]